MKTTIFPENFMWGTATAAYQIEGGHLEDGKSPSVWDTFVQKKGKINSGDTGDIACDHYHLFEQDVDVMAKLGYPWYRFSISWPRLIRPDGSVNTAGADFYNRLIDVLLSKGIKPCVTLFHWDLPDYIQQRGGWYKRETAVAFADYCEAAGRLFGDRVSHWITMNEPWIHTAAGHVLGLHAPGITRPFSALKVAHHMLLGHGMAVQRLRSVCPEASIGITNALSPVHPYRIDKKVEAVDVMRAYACELWLDPILKKRYPPKIANYVQQQAGACIHDGDMEIISSTIDFIGVNNYTRTIVKNSWRPHYKFKMVDADYKGIERTAMGWEVYPRGIYEILMWLKETYGDIPILITENGIALDDTVENGEVHDECRIEFLKRYLREVKQAIDMGVNCQGYFVWSFLDNFEWAEGYSKRFGLIYVDYDDPSTQRYPKQSAYWYSDVCKTNRLD
jgi:beta-glucosidase